MAEKKVPYRKGSWEKKSLYKKEDEVKNRATEAKKNPSIPKWIIGWTKKKSSMEKEKDHEVKNRVDERTDGQKKSTSL